MGERSALCRETRHQPDTEEKLVEDEVLLTAVIHWVQTIGEAANAVSVELWRQYPEVPWRQVIVDGLE